jgi:hypothetical protein
MDDLNRVEPTEAEKEAERRAADKSQDEALATRIKVGYDHYREHGHTTVLRLSQRERGFTYPRHEQIDQLCGFMDAMCDEIRTLREKVAEHEKMMKTTHIVMPEDRRAELSNMLEHRQMGTGELLGHVEVGSITDAYAIITSNSVLFAEFCAFLDGFDGHPVDGFREWMKTRGTPLSNWDSGQFDRNYHDVNVERYNNGVQSG